MRDMHNEENELRLIEMGYVKITGFSRYLKKGEEFMIINRMRPVKRRKDKRIQLTSDRDVRLNMKWETACQLPTV